MKLKRSLVSLCHTPVVCPPGCGLVGLNVTCNETHSTLTTRDHTPTEYRRSVAQTHYRSKPRRSGFTLVEVIAALVIGTILLAAVYSTLEIMLRSIRVGKEAVQSLQVIRGTAIRLQTDIRQNLSLLMTTPSIQAQLSTTTTPPTSTPTTETAPEPAQFNFGVQGDQYSLTLYGSQAPRYSKMDAETPNSVYSDLRTITYTCQPGTGLIRSETINILGGTGTPDVEEVLASEVQEMYFRYYDAINQTWTSEWDGTSNGPPSAIEITLTVQMPDIPGVRPRAPVNHRLVIAIPAFGSPIVPSSGGTTQ
jgi:prepilin-type N-terminal cleavage/methylation domain-containing protein